MKLTEKAAYLKGLCEGLKPDTDKPEGKLILELINTVSEMAEEIAALEADAKNLREYVEELDEDLGAVEEDFYGCEDEEDEDDFDDDLDPSDYFQLECPSCGETICFDDSVDPSELTCPACGESIECEIECDGDCDGCEGCEDTGE